ncbi:transketolase-like protein 2 [Anthonomus grandis grandis]|uniref:transketolase-like protein 2 n=1 Tax=Anthonomus grandis grandis TaxID=2921223 RepID=UPI002165AFB9|nr:transketolase-like protein 2 [Anthonomus grandis grandis]
MPLVTDAQVLKDLATRIRILSVKSTSAANSGHPTTSSSAAEILSVLFFNTMRYTTCSPKDISSDRFVLSKGHAAPALYAAWVENGVIPEAELLKLRQLGSDLEGHPTPRLNFIDVGTGSLGQGLSNAAGMAYVTKNYDNIDARIYCLIGDGECAEGSIWEAIQFISYYNLDNLVLIIDVNRLGQSEPTALGHDLESYKSRLAAFGWNSLAVDGHNVEDLVKAFDTASATKGKPTAIIAKTFKGRDFPDIEDKEGWHGKPLGKETERVLEHLEGLLVNKGKLKFTIPKPITKAPAISIENIKLASPPNYKLGQCLATRNAYGTALVKLAKSNPRVIALDGDMKNSTFSEDLKKFDNTKYIECFIAEQNMVGVAIGAACRDRTVAFVSTFGAFLARAYDQIRMGAISQSNVNFVGSHCGVSIGEDGASQMGLEDISMFRSIPGSTVFYPADAVAAERAIELAANTPGITFTRTNRPATKIIYPNDQEFQVGKSNVLMSTTNDKVLFIGGGVTLMEGLKAAEELATQKIGVRVLDLFTIKPIDQEGIIKNAKECGGRILVVEDHYPEGGIGEAVLTAVSEERDMYVKKVAVPRVPRSGTPAQVLDYYGLTAKHIVNYVLEVIKN